VEPISLRKDDESANRTTFHAPCLMINIKIQQFILAKTSSIFDYATWHAFNVVLHLAHPCQRRLCYSLWLFITCCPSSCRHPSSQGPHGCVCRTEEQFEQSMPRKRYVQHIWCFLSARHNASQESRSVIILFSYTAALTWFLRCSTTSCPRNHVYQPILVASGGRILELLLHGLFL
jgi:hypothetical protein